jgi:hypothetical protein
MKERPLGPAEIEQLAEVAKLPDDMIAARAGRFHFPVCWSAPGSAAGPGSRDGAQALGRLRYPRHGLLIAWSVGTAR